MIQTPRKTSNNRGWQKHFDTLVWWADNCGYTVVSETNAEDSIDYDNKTIYINSTNWAECRYYTLLHECGHLLIDNTRESFDRYVPCSRYAHSMDGRTTKTDAYKVSLITEEIDAWKRGLRLADRLGLPVNRKKFDAEMVKSVMSYIEAAAAKSVMSYIEEKVEEKVAARSAS